MSEPATKDFPPGNWRTALGDPWFHICLQEAIAIDEFMENCFRLRGTPMIPHPRSPIEAMVDKACGVTHGPSREDMDAFCQFVFDYVYRIVERPTEMPPVGASDG